MTEDGKLEIAAGMALQANYAYRLLPEDATSLYLEVHFLASPQRDLSSPIPRAGTDFATIYLTPGGKLKFLPHARLSPCVVVGGGQNNPVLSGGIAF